MLKATTVDSCSGETRSTPGADTPTAGERAYIVIRHAAKKGSASSAGSAVLVPPATIHTVLPLPLPTLVAFSRALAETAIAPRHTQTHTHTHTHSEVGSPSIMETPSTSRLGDNWSFAA